MPPAYQRAGRYVVQKKDSQMKRWMFFLLFINLTVLASGAQRVDPLVDSANNAYAEQNYEKAVGFYEKVLEKDLESAELYYNLGNAYYKLHDIASAILNYERARQLAPNDEDIQYNLELARKQITDKIEPIPEFFLLRWSKKALNLFSSNAWALMSLISFIAFLVLFSVYLYSGKLGVKKSSFWIAIIALIISIASFSFSYQQKQDLVNSREAIVFSQKVTVKSSPSESGTGLFVIHRGVKVYVVDNEIKGWYEVKLADGNKGWLKRETVEPI